MGRLFLPAALGVNAIMLWTLIVVPHQARQETARLALAEQRSSAAVCRQLWVDDYFGFRPLMAACAHEVVEQGLRAGKSIGDARRQAAKQCIVVLDACTKGLVK